jgi:Flp pilus assembly protein TadD
MEKTRLQMLREASNATPSNAFLRYGLAMELKSSGREEEAVEQFRHLLEHHPDYAATYYQAGMLLLKLGRREEARQVMTRGLEVNTRLGNSHARDELQAALDEIGD